MWDLDYKENSPEELMLFIYLFIFISCRLITLQYCSGFCHTLTWISHGFTCIPHPDPPSHIPLHPNWCFWTMVLEKTLECPLDCKEIQLVNPKGNQSWTFIIKSDAEAETPILWTPNKKNWLIGEEPDARKDWRQEEMGTTGDEMVGRHLQLDGQEFEQALGIGDGQGILAN